MVREKRKINPEIAFLLRPPVAPVEVPKRPPVIKVSCGIGDTDGFPAFDVDSDNYATPDDPKWGFQITGGAEFHMPITVFQVSDDGLAYKGGIRLGDIILSINDTDASTLTLAQAHELIDSSTKKMHIVARGMEDDDLPDELRGEEKSIVLRVPKPPPPPKEFTPTSLLGSRVWHPVMWHDPPPPPKPKKTKINEDGEEVTDSEAEEEEKKKEEELPHHRIIRNIRRFFKETEANPELKNKYIEDMLLILPSGSKDPVPKKDHLVVPEAVKNVFKNIK